MLVAQTCLTVYDTIDWSPPGSSVHGFSRQEYWSGLPCPPPADLPDTEIIPASLMFPVLAGGFFTSSITWEAPFKPLYMCENFIQYKNVYIQEKNSPFLPLASIVCLRGKGHVLVSDYPSRFSPFVHTYKLFLFYQLSIFNEVCASLTKDSFIVGMNKLPIHPVMRMSN